MYCHVGPGWQRHRYPKHTGARGQVIFGNTEADHEPGGRGLVNGDSIRLLVVMSFTQVLARGHRQGRHDPMPPAAALVGLPCTAMSAPGGSISSVAGIPSTPVLGDMLSLGGLLIPRMTTKIPVAGA